MSIKEWTRIHDKLARVDAIQHEIDEMKEKIVELGAAIEANGLLLDTIAQQLAELEADDDVVGELADA